MTYFCVITETMKMKKLLLIIPFAIVLVFFACNKEKGNSNIQMDFDFEYGDQSFEINKIYNYNFGYEVKFEKMILYVSDVRFIESDGTIAEGPNIIFVDASSDGNKISFDIPEGNYSKIEFSIGVPESLNGTDNPDFDASLYDHDSPLSLSKGMYWTWNSGYRFILMDGRTNTDPMVDDVFETLLSIHTGKEYSYRSNVLSININAAKDQTIPLKLKFNVEGFLNHPDDVIDIAVDNQSHGTNENLANRLSDNAIKSVEIK